MKIRPTFFQTRLHLSKHALHAAKGTETFIPEFSDKYIVTVIVESKDENEMVNIIRSNTKVGKIFLYQLSRAIDIATGNENEKAI